MKLYNRDYNVLTTTELIAYSQILEKEKEGMIGTLKTKNLFREYPKAVRHNKSLFPNNYLDFVELDNREEIESTVEQFLTKLNDKSIKNEIDVLKFINKDTRAFYLIGSIFNYYDFGHHDAYVFPEFQLSEMYKVDYLLIGKNSDGYSFIFVELEHPVKDITLKSGELGNAFRKGINQLKDWQTLLITNFAGVTNTLKKYKHPDVQLPDEFYTLDPTRFHYTVVAGRRDDLADKTRKIRREHQIQQGIKLLHYDNICDNTLALLNQRNY